MSGSVRKRKSKWDLKEESQFAKISSNNVKAGDSNLDDWSDLEANDGLKSNDNFELDSWEPLSGNGGAQKDVRDNREFNEVSETMRGWVADNSYSMRTSPSFDGRVQKRYGRSPRNNWRQSNRLWFAVRFEVGSDIKAAIRAGWVDYNVNPCQIHLSTCPTHAKLNLRGRSRSRSRSRGRSKTLGRSVSSSRSWSRSRSRSLSRSPHVDFKRDSYGFSERSRNGSGVSSQRCRDFVAGRCSRGSQCRFLHQDNLNYRDGGRSEIDQAESWESRQEHRRASRYADAEGPIDYPRDKVARGGYGNQYDGEKDVPVRNNSRSNVRCNDFLKGKCHRGSSCKFSHHGASGDRYDRHDRDHERKREPHRVGGILCKYFAMGKCFNGDRCRFSHDDPPCDSPEGRPRDGKWGHNLDDENKPWEDTKWNGAAALDIAKSSEWGSNDNGNKNFTDSMVADKSIGNSWGQSLDNENKPWATSASKDKASEGDSWGSSHWRARSNIANTGIPELMSSAKLSVKEEPLLTPLGSQAQTLNGISRPAHEQNIMQDTSSLQLATSFMRPTVSGDSYVQQHLGKSGDNTAMVDGSSHDRVNFSVHTLHVPRQSFNKDGDNLGSQPPLSFNETSQSQHMCNLNPLNGHTIDLNGPVQRINSPLNLQSQTQCCQGESVETPEMMECKVPQVISGTPRNFITNNPVGQMSSLSESLAQVFGNGQQLLQPYAVLNTPNSMDLVSSHSNTAGLVPSITSMTVQPNAATCFQEQYQAESLEPSKPGSSSQPHGYSLNPSEQKTLVPSKGFSLSMMSASAGTNSAEMIKIGNSEDEHCKSPKMKQQEPVANSEVKGNIKEVAEECKQELEKGHLENLDADGGVDEGNRIKDEKGMRIFKNALVEFVKEILKPTWKEGQMSREVHKTIVKKVVDKVTGESSFSVASVFMEVNFLAEVKCFLLANSLHKWKVPPGRLDGKYFHGICGEISEELGFVDHRDVIVPQIFLLPFVLSDLLWVKAYFNLELWDMVKLQRLFSRSSDILQSDPIAESWYWGSSSATSCKPLGSVLGSVQVN
ncbi:Zinc finger CCCH domain-containing protein 55 [Vitis vinifera]|uniref:Zinc finger CCCH domain-containing protein 55 n=1 Tax=Vitis vinifera TaxID=29760 RepID=A0A438HKU7_VITVI|nr:Zinc finger CCCH domain-containing protein 55 [Vitis vinifera]